MIPENIEIGRAGSVLSVIIRRNRVIASPTNIETSLHDFRYQKSSYFVDNYTTDFVQ
jgi:hypothetical protein